MQNQKPEIQQLLEWQKIAELAAQQAGELLRQKLSEPMQIMSKGYRDLVTDSDFAAQMLITNLVQEHFPTHGFLTEEEDSALPEGRQVSWIIDPIDGTSNFSRRLPDFCVSIGVAYGEEIVVGVIYSPIHDELFTTIRGGGSRCNGQPMHVAETDSIEESIIGFDWGRSLAQRTSSLNALNSVGYDVRSIRGFGSAALALAWIAAGRLDAYINFGLSTWDIAAGGLLIEEAGGQISDATGNPLTLDPPASCLATNGHLHSPLLQVIPVAKV